MIFLMPFRVGAYNFYALVTENYEFVLRIHFRSLMVKIQEHKKIHYIRV